MPSTQRFGLPGPRCAINANSHLEPQLDAFARLSGPGFALLVDAPWGAGKTCAVWRWLSERKRRLPERNDSLYVSVYGAKDSSAIEDSLFQAHLEAKNVTSRRRFNQVLKDIAPQSLEFFTKKYTGANVDFTGAYRRFVLKDIPEILVFDDLERTEMPLPELFGAINRYVEHEGRTVVLLANQAELRGKDPETYDRTKEKVIGRIIAIGPDVAAAVAGFLAAMEKDEQQRAAYEFLAAEKDLLCSVFETSQVRNLRLLRYVMLEFARAFDRIPEVLRAKEKEEAMRHLLATFVALSISFHSGDGLGFEGLRQEIRWTRLVSRANGQVGEVPLKSALEVLQKRLIVSRGVV